MNKSAIWQELSPKKLFPVAMLGLVIGSITLPLMISFAVLIYAGDLSSYASLGIGMTLFGAIIMQLIIGFTNSAQGVLGGPQDSPAAILALVAVTISANMASATPEARFATVVATVALTTFVAGVLFLLIGGFKLGRLIRFIPYPVVGGFIAGTGLLLAQGAFGVMTNSNIGMTNLLVLFQNGILLRWIPGSIFAVLLLLISRRSQHFLVIPGMITASVLLFYGTIWISGLKLEEIRAMGWLLGPFPSGALWKPLDFSILGQVNWGLIGAQVSNLGAAVGISVVALLLNASALELIGKQDIDLNRELVSAGIANIAASFSGSHIGYHFMGLSALPMRTGLTSRLIAVFSSILLGLVLLFGATLLAFIPKFIVGGLILFLGLSFLAEWVYDAWFRLPHTDYVMVLSILVVVGWFGFLQGVGAGLAIAMILFVVNYSRIDIVKDTLTGITYRSNLERPIEHRHLLQGKGDVINILRLQGFIFFGTAQNLLDRIRERISASKQTRLRYLILDFQHVSSLDSSAAQSFVRIQQLTETNKIILVFTGLSSDIRTSLKKDALVEDKESLRFFPTLDYGMEWCETNLLTAEGTSTIMRAATLHGQLKGIFLSSEMAERFMKYLEKEEVDAFHTIINQGDPSDAMYFVESGQVTTNLQVSPDRFIRLRSMGAGSTVGEVGLYLRTPRIATVVATEPTVLHRLSIEALKSMEQKDPELASLLHRWIVKLLAERLSDNNRTLEALLN